MQKIAEIWQNYDESFNFLEQRKLRQVNQLVLLNNLQRGDQNISSTLLLTLFQRVLSNLYDDKLQIKFIPGEEVDQKKINTLNLLAQNDYREMGKDQIDYDWCWDALFFGQGYVETLHFDKKRKILKPHVINPLAMGFDPYFPNPKDWRYYWKWITKDKWDLVKMIKNGDITGVKSVDEIPAGMDEYLWEYKVKRDSAMKANAVPPDTMNTNSVYQILEYYGYNDEGKKCVYWTDKNFAKILMEEELDLRDGEDGESEWPIVKKEAFREPHSSLNFSIADLLEDKHRAKSVLLNLAYIAAKDKANPIYVVNPSKVQDISAFFQRQINQHILLKDTGNPQEAVQPLSTQDPMSAGLIQFISMLTQEANDPVGTGMSGNPMKKGKQTATDSAIQQQLNDLAQSLQSKVMQFGEMEFWSQWYHRYKRYTKAGNTKIATILGVKGMTFETIDLGDIQTKFPPGVMVFSAKEAEYKELVLRRDLMQLYPQFQESLGPDGMRNFNKYVFFPKFLQDPSLIDIILPKTLDEIKAEDENERLNENSMPNVAETDNHEQHIYIHMMAKKTWATWTHIAWHEELLAQQKKQEQDQAKQQSQGQPEQPQTGQGQKDAKKPKVGEKQKQPMNAAASLQDNIQPKGNK